MSKIEDAVAKKLLDRAKVGENKYGTTMERNDLSLQEWLTHLQEELMDACVYVEKLKQEVEYQEYELSTSNETDKIIYHPHLEFADGHPFGPCSMHDEVSEEEIMAELDAPVGSIEADLAEIKREERMKIIGQNGNDGLHYGQEEDGTGYVNYPDSVDVAVSTEKPCGWNNTRTVYPGDIEITYTQVKQND